MPVVAPNSETPEIMTDSADNRALKKTLGRYPTGVTVVTARRGDGEPVGLTVNSFTSVSLDPPLILWCLGNESPNRPVFEQAEHFAVNILGAEQGWVSSRFAQPIDDKFATVKWSEGAHGVPIIEGSVARLVCRLHDRQPGGDHVILLGRVEDYQNPGGEPLVYLGGEYQSLRDD